MRSTRYKVVGMTCDSCVDKVKEELSKLSDVSKTEVELKAGDDGESQVEVFAEGEAEATRIDVAKAVKEAGFNVVIE